MNYETKWDVFEDALRALEEFGEQGSSWEMAYDDLSARYSAASDDALLDNMPVIPKAIGEYITSCKARMMDLHDSMFNWLRSEEEDEFMDCHSEIFARAWLLGVWRVEETGEIMKLEAEK
ncbi:hypothetical protein [Latilactobacillus sakei]|uniref:hypothetical protein n=1 Tax=Latilactobacillus sakei TaxID=1599 RepID=UPI002073266C|nr:hypothetical protein [Latilactobacillus sakei]USF96103.1 hypothetical protein A4W82_04450 [Latilactobacillus sakei]